ncbi:hypothetical protein niasHT_012788 [Heterodera trifolii]|uniref:Glycoside hydrolase family 5 domain-containing protein n=1 Tax=Heterodera trifolii TaxID=157864 RepID=A0ABD2L925_9BILA
MLISFLFDADGKLTNSADAGKELRRRKQKDKLENETKSNDSPPTNINAKNSTPAAGAGPSLARTLTAAGLLTMFSVGGAPVSNAARPVTEMVPPARQEMHGTKRIGEQYYVESPPTVPGGGVNPGSQTLQGGTDPFGYPTHGGQFGQVFLNGTYDEKPKDNDNPSVDNPSVVNPYTLHFYASSHFVNDLGNKLKTAVNKGLPVFVTEYGTCEASGNGQLNSGSMSSWWSLLDQLKISYVNWAIADKSEACAALTGGTSAANVGTSSRWTQSGNMVASQHKKKPNGVKC